MNRQSLVDPRGYVGAERNRVLSPQEVLIARQQYHERQVTARQLAVQYGLSVDSVRRMLRGDTYANVGEALPRVAEIAAVGEVDDGGAFERLVGAVAAPGSATERPSFDEPTTIEPDDGEEAVLAFLRSEEAKRP